MAFVFPTATDLLAAYGPLVADRVPETFDSVPFEHLTVSPVGAHHRG